MGCLKPIASPASRRGWMGAAERAEKHAKGYIEGLEMLGLNALRAPTSRRNMLFVTAPRRLSKH